jgi:outer membrane protein assembly factor BamB
MLTEPSPTRSRVDRLQEKRHACSRWRSWWLLALGLLVVLAAGVAGVWSAGLLGPAARHTSAAPSPPTQSAAAQAPSTSPSSVQPSPTVPAAVLPAVPGPINTSFPGLTTFRGNATRDWYGEGPLPKHPVIRWRYPSSGALCSQSHDLFGTRTWCGTGWTGQPNVIVHKDHSIEVREGAYDGHYHFIDGHTGARYRPDLVTGDLAKGSASSDNDGYPLYYGGSRDNFLRVVALDRPTPTVLWKYESTSTPNLVWNNDWDGCPLQVGDYLLEGGENSWFYVIRLHRHYDKNGLVQVNPKIVMEVPGYDQQLFAEIHDKDVSIEDSVAFDPVRQVAYFANSGGLVEGWDIGEVLHGGTHFKRVFRFWDGDDTDATIVIDPSGDLIVGRKMEENVSRSAAFPRDHQIGDLMKLDPTKPKDPVVWSVQLGGYAPDDGVLGTPALYQGVVYATFTDSGFAAVDDTTGKLLWQQSLPGPVWSSPVPVDGQLLVGDCAGSLHDFDISDPRHAPRELWSIQLGGCIESTPAVWHGWIYVGSRIGAIFGIADPR